MEAENLTDYVNIGYVNENGYMNKNIVKPIWKYEKFSGKIRPPTTILICDDVIGSTALSASEYFTKLFIMNRHI